MSGFLGLFDYSKHPPKDAPAPKGILLFFIIFFSNFWKLVSLNLLFLVFCIPIVTIPAAVSAMTYVLRNMTLEKPIFLWMDFRDTFKSNFKKSFLFGLLCAVIGALSYVSIRYYFEMIQSDFLFYIPGTLTLAVAIIALIAIFYAFLMIVTLDLPLLAIIRNALALTFIAFGRNLLTLLIVLLLLAITIIYLPFTAILLLFISFSFLGLIVSFRTFPIVKKYVIANSKDLE